MTKVMKGAKEQPNKDLIDYDDLPRDKVERKDGLPTIDDLKELFAPLFNGQQQQQLMPNISINIGFGSTIDKLGKTIDSLQGESDRQPNRKESLSSKILKDR